MRLPKKFTNTTNFQVFNVGDQYLAYGNKLCKVRKRVITDHGGVQVLWWRIMGDRYLYEFNDNEVEIEQRIRRCEQPSCDLVFTRMVGGRLKFSQDADNVTAAYVVEPNTGLLTGIDLGFARIINSAVGDFNVPDNLLDLHESYKKGAVIFDMGFREGKKIIRAMADDHESALALLAGAKRII